MREIRVKTTVASCVSRTVPERIGINCGDHRLGIIMQGFMCFLAVTIGLMPTSSYATQCAVRDTHMHKAELCLLANVWMCC